MISGRAGAMATGRLMLILGGAMVLFIGRNDIMVITSGLLIALGGIYILSLVSPATKQFIGDAWPERLCRMSAAIAGLLMVASGFISSIGGIREMLIFHDSAEPNLVLFGILSLCWGIYILKLVISGVQSQYLISSPNPLP